jgi:hypothetical protein
MGTDALSRTTRARKRSSTVFGNLPNVFAWTWLGLPLFNTRPLDEIVNRSAQGKESSEKQIQADVVCGRLHLGDSRLARTELSSQFLLRQVTFFTQGPYSSADPEPQFHESCLFWTQLEEIFSASDVVSSLLQGDLFCFFHLTSPLFFASLLRLFVERQPPRQGS